MADNDNILSAPTTSDDAVRTPTEELELLLAIMDYQATTKDLSIRMPENSNTNISRIAKHYNALISEFENLTQELEKHINRRTAQISRINNSLANEVMDRKIAEHAQAEALQQAELANNAKSTFLANMSHELRTPLNSIIGFSEMMSQGIFGEIENERYTGYINDIHYSGSHLLKLINDILDLSKIEAESMLLEEDETEIPDLINHSITLIKPLVENKNQNLTIDIPEDCPPLICDRLRINQVLINLLSNAIKFTPKGGDIGLSISLEENCAMTFKISDTGKGIPEDSLEKIFEPFTQVEDITTRTIQGTGLGLSLVRSLVELHDGQIGIESTLGKGTDIFIFFPPERTLQI